MMRRRLTIAVLLASALLFSIGGAGRGPGLFDDSEDPAFDPGGNLVAADSGNHRLQALTREGKSFE